MNSRYALILLLFAGILSSCGGYVIGHTGHPQIKTIAIGEILNETDEPRLAITMTQMLKQRILEDGTYRLVHPEEADVIISGTLTHIRYRSAGAILQKDNDNRDERRDRAYRTDLYSTSLTFQHKFTTRKNWEIFGSNRAGGQAQFSEGLDQIEGRREALKRAAYNLSRQVVAHITEGW